VNIPSSPAALAASAAPPSAADREVKLTSYLIVAAILVGAVLQVWVPPGGLTLVAGSGLAGAVAVAVALVAPGRVRTTMAGFRFVATLLFVLAVFAMLGTLVLQGKPAAFYIERYGFVGTLIVALRFDDIFHGLPFALVMALFGASIIASATLRWPIKAKNTGYWLCHLGLMTSLLGAAASASLAVRGRIDLFAGGEHATQVRVTKAGAPTGEMAALGFDLRLDRFEALNDKGKKQTTHYTVNKDEGPRADTSLEALAKLKPVFAAGGSVTAGNSSQMSDGAAFVIVMSEAMVKELKLEPIARLVNYAAAGVPPRIMGIGPVKAIPKALKLAGLQQGDVELIELNEAFASQSLAVIRELELNPEIINVNGGAIALGHPLGCTGAKLSVQLFDEMRKRKMKGKYGMVTMCVGTGQGAAGIYEFLN
jgi:hypothetical protein